MAAHLATGAISTLGFHTLTGRVRASPENTTGLHQVRVSGAVSFQGTARCNTERRSRLLRRLTVKAAQENSGNSSDDEVQDSRILQYCDINKKANKKTIGELESDFLEALQSFYFEGKPTISNEEFDNLKEELTWEGSSVVIMSSDEQKFMEAFRAYGSGKKVLTDEEYDLLKLKLKQSGSKVAIEGPRCSLRSKKVYSDSQVDYIRMTLLNLPAAIIALGIVFFFDDISGFEITYLLELPEPYSFLFTWFVVLPATFLMSQAITNNVLKDALILKGPCPNCGVENISYFGSILTVENKSRTNLVKCECGRESTFDLDSRLITLEDEKPAPPPKAPPKPKKAKVVAA